MDNNGPIQQRLTKPAHVKVNENRRLAPSANLDAWDYKYEVDKGKPISSPSYSGHPKQIPNPPDPLSSDWKSIAKKAPSTGPVSYGVSKWHDPEPEQPIVDVKNDDEFLGALGTDPTTTTLATLRNHQSHSPETISSPPPAPPQRPPSKSRGKKSRRNKRFSSNSTLEDVLREMLPARTDPSTSSSGMKSDIRETLNESHDEYKYDEIKLCSSECNESFLFPRQILELSGEFSERMKASGFDGVITTIEGKEAMELLAAWLSTRNLDFDINIGDILFMRYG